MTKAITNRTPSIVVLFLAVFLFGYAGQAQTLGSLYTQGGNEQLYIEEGASLKSALEKLEQHYNVGLLYRSSIVESVTIRQSAHLSSNIEEALSFLLKGTDLRFKSLNPKTYGIYKNIVFNPYVLEPEVQEIVRGMVVDAQTGEPLPGVNIFIEGTTIGTTTDINGNYEISVPSLEETLVFSFIGYLRQEVDINGRTEININLITAAIEGDELIVVGYGAVRHQDLTGSVSRADIESFREQPNVSIMQSLHGTLPGVQIGQVNQAGQEPSISIRGRTTLSGNTSPLIVVDGIPYRGRIADLNPRDILSVDVLKDASSKAMYGAQAANGVILITTQSGRESPKPIITYSGSVSSQTPATDTRLLNREEVLQKIRNIEYRNAYLGPDYTTPNPEWDFPQSQVHPVHLRGIENGTDFDWWDALTSPGLMSNHQLSISGGSQATTYYLSGGYTDQEGYIMNDNYQRTSARLNIQTDVTDWLTLGANTFGAFVDVSGSFPNINNIANTSPLALPRDEDGEFIINPLDSNALNVFLHAQSDDRNHRNRIGGNFFAILEIPQVEGLTYRLNYSNNYIWNSHSYSNPYMAGRSGLAYKINSSNLDNLMDNILTYDTQIGNHGATVTLVAGYNKIRDDWTQASGENFSDLTLSYNSLQQALIVTNQSSAWEESSLYQIGRINYNYRHRYLLTASLRRDGFSGFSRNNKFGWFPSVGIAWIVSDESFFDISGIDFLKLRTSYGKIGNQTDRYSSLARVDTGSSRHYTFGGSTAPGQSVASLSNDELSWESTSELNLGIDFEILNERIRGTIDFYNTTTTDLLWDLSLPQMSGFSQVRTNLGKIENTGFEFALQTSPVRTGDFSWDLNVNFSTNSNKIVELIGDEDLVASGLFIGESIGAIYDYEVDGIWQLDDDIPSGFFPGTYRIVDQDGDGTISAEDDRIILGRSEPAFRMGFQNSFNYKNFSLRFFIHTVQGGKNGYLGANHPSGVQSTPSTAQYGNWFTMYDYWSPSNPGAKYPVVWENPTISPQRYDSRSFIRLQDISLAWRLNPSFVQRMGLGSLKVYASGKNLLTITDWNGWDPETGQGPGNNASVFPVMKSYTFGVDISF